MAAKGRSHINLAGVGWGDVSCGYRTCGLPPLGDRKVRGLLSLRREDSALRRHMTHFHFEMFIQLAAGGLLRHPR